MAEQNTKQATAARTLTVACNLPHGITLRAFVAVTTSEAVIGGGVRDVTEYRETGERFVVHGNAQPATREPSRHYPEIANGYALTHGVPADLWEHWLKANKDSAYVVNKCVFAVERDPVGEAKRSGEKLSGQEPINPDGDKRLSRGARNVTGITQGERDKAA